MRCLTAVICDTSAAARAGSIFNISSGSSGFGGVASVRSVMIGSPLPGRMAISDIAYLGML